MTGVTTLSTPSRKVYSHNSLLGAQANELFSKVVTRAERELRLLQKPSGPVLLVRLVDRAKISSYLFEFTS